MTGQSRFVFLCLLTAFTLNATATAGEPAVKFDVPALIGVHEVEFAEGHEQRGSTRKTIEIVIPISSEVAAGDRQNIDEFRFDIYWNRNVYPLADYGPKTRTVSDIEGLISVEKTSDKNATFGINLGSGYQDVVTGTAKADLSNRNGTKLKYQEVPDHDVLVASGTVQRGTGAFFRFHPSKRETLEGGRDLIVAYRVPHSWRGGVIKIECRAKGHRTIVGSWSDSFEENRAFVIPVYLEGDDQARRAAVEFVRSEQGLRQNWQRHQSRKPQPSLGMFSFPVRSDSLAMSLPDQWVHLLIQSGNDEFLTKYRARLPESIVSAADQFADARQELFRLSR